MPAVDFSVDFTVTQNTAYPFPGHKSTVIVGMELRLHVYDSPVAAREPYLIALLSSAVFINVTRLLTGLL